MVLRSTFDDLRDKLALTEARVAVIEGDRTALATRVTKAEQEASVAEACLKGNLIAAGRKSRILSVRCLKDAADYSVSIANTKQGDVEMRLVPKEAVRG